MVDYKTCISSFKKLSAMVIGDFVCDIFLYTHPKALSREAPVVVTEYEREEWLPGCAGNTVHNLASLGAKVYPVGILGDDNYKDFLINFFSQFNVDTSGLFICRGKITPCKMRILSGDFNTRKQQIARIDKNPPYRLEKKVEDKIIGYIWENYKKVDFIIISDYNYEILNENLAKNIRKIARNKLIIGDSHERLGLLKGISAVTPNKSEAINFLESIFKNSSTQKSEPDIIQCGQKIMKLLNLRYVLITLGNQGMVIFDKCLGHKKIPVYGVKEPVDVTGAGDTVVSVFSLALASSLDSFRAAELSNIAASLVIMKSGSAVVTPQELISALPKLAT